MAKGQSINQQTMVLMQLSRDLIAMLDSADSLTEIQTTAIKRHLNGLQRALDLKREDFSQLSFEKRIDTVLDRLKTATDRIDGLRRLARY